MNIQKILLVIGSALAALSLCSCVVDIPVHTGGQGRPMGPPPSVVMNRQQGRPMGQPMMNQNRRPMMQQPPGYSGGQGGYNGRPPQGYAGGNAYGYNNRPRQGYQQGYPQGSYYNQGQQPIRRPNNYGDAASSYVDPQNPFRRPVIRYIPMDPRRHPVR